MINYITKKNTNKQLIPLTDLRLFLEDVFGSIDVDEAARDLTVFRDNNRLFVVPLASASQSVIALTSMLLFGSSFPISLKTF